MRLSWKEVYDFEGSRASVIKLNDQGCGLLIHYLYWDKGDFCLFAIFSNSH